MLRARIGIVSVVGLAGMIACVPGAQAGVSGWTSGWDHPITQPATVVSAAFAKQWVNTSLRRRAGPSAVREP